MIFQLKDDLKNFGNFEDKPVLNDLKSGVMTAPVIFLAKQNPQIYKLLENKKYEQIYNLLINSQAIAQTEELINEYYEKAILFLKELGSSKYSDALMDLLTQIREQ